MVAFFVIKPAQRNSCLPWQLLILAETVAILKDGTAPKAPSFLVEIVELKCM